MQREQLSGPTAAAHHMIPGDQSQALSWWLLPLCREPASRQFSTDSRFAQRRQQASDVTLGTAAFVVGIGIACQAGVCKVQGAQRQPTGAGQRGSLQ